MAWGGGSRLARAPARALLLVLTGALRVSYTGILSSPAMRGKRRNALTKHAAFLSVFVVATVVALQAV